ncbi:hypothetical protein TRAPUB_5995, partial [Trametes pubescens]
TNFDATGYKLCPPCLQLVDVVSRARTATPGQPAQDLRGFLKPLRAEVERSPALYADIYALRGLAHAVGWFQLLPKGKGGGDQTLKDPAVVAMHESGGSAFWLARPLPSALLTYAAHDLTLIALLYAHFTRRAWVRKTMQALQAQSVAYVGSIGSREENARLGELDLKRFMPLGIVDGGGEDAGPWYECACCARELAVGYYMTRVVGVEGGERQGVGYARRAQGRQRLSYCRLCSAVARRNERRQGEWVAC